MLRWRFHQLVFQACIVFVDESVDVEPVIVVVLVGRRQYVRSSVSVVVYALVVDHVATAIGSVLHRGGWNFVGWNDVLGWNVVLEGVR